MQSFECDVKYEKKKGDIVISLECFALCQGHAHHLGAYH